VLQTIYSATAFMDDGTSNHCLCNIPSRTRNVSLVFLAFASQLTSTLGSPLRYRYCLLITVSDIFTILLSQKKDLMFRVEDTFGLSCFSISLWVGEIADEHVKTAYKVPAQGISLNSNLRMAKTRKKLNNTPQICTDNRAVNLGGHGLKFRG